MAAGSSKYHFLHSSVSQHAISATMQFLKDSGLVSSLAALQNETNHLYDDVPVETGSLLLTALECLAQRDSAAEELSRGSVEEDSKQQEQNLLVRGCGDNICMLSQTNTEIHSANIIACRFVSALAWSKSAGVSCSSNDLVIATSSVDKQLRLTNLTNASQTLFEVTVKSPILSMEFHPTSRTLLLCSCMDGSIMIIDTACRIKEQAIIFQSQQHRKYVVAVRWFSDGLTFAAASYDHTVTIWTAVSLANYDFRLKHELLFTGTVESIEFIKNSPVLAISVRDDNCLHMFNLKTMQEDTKMNLNTNLDNHVSFTVMHMCSNSDGSLLLVTTDKHRAMIYLVGQSKVLRNFYGATNDEYANPRALWSHDERYVYCTSQDHTLVCWEVATQRQVGKLMGHTALVRDLAYDADTNCLLSCGFDKTVRVWKTAP